MARRTLPLAVKVGIQAHRFYSKLNFNNIRLRKLLGICFILCAVGIILSNVILESWKTHPQWQIYRRVPAPRINDRIFYTLKDIVAKVPTNPEEAFNNVTNLLRQKWNHNHRNAALFKFIFQERIRMNTHSYLMHTRENTVLGSKLTTLKGKATADEEMFQFVPQGPLLPEPPYNTCSVVGSSGILLGSQCGNEIDKADVVFRFNLAPTWTFETDVGGKTNITTMNPSIISKIYGELKNSSDINRFASLMSKQKGIICSPAFQYASNIPISMEAIKKGSRFNANLTFAFENFDHFKAVTHFWKEFGMYHGIRKVPSSGFHFISSALALCTHVNVYGFWPFELSSDGRTVKYHYYDELDGRHSHDMSSEFRTIIGLHQLGLLQMRVSNCTDNVP